MKGKIKNYYAGGNTCIGFYSLFESNLKGLDRVFILKGGPGTGKSSLMKKVGYEWVDNGYDIEFLHCSSDNDSIDGVIIPKLKVGIVDGTAPHVIEPRAPGAIENYVNLGAAWDCLKLSSHKDEIIKIKESIKSAFESAYSVFGDALKIHDEWEKVYISNMDFSKASELTGYLINLFFKDKKLDKKPVVKDRFFGAATPKGAVDFIQNLTDDISKRYFVKGRPGTGKSTMLRKLAAEAEQRGFDVEIYHCGFDPNSLDMVIFRELDIAIFDSTAPHEYFPDRVTDEIIDMYEKAVEKGTDEKFKTEIADITSRYKSKMSLATSFLSNAKKLHDELEKIYIEAMNFDKVNILKDEINTEIKRISGKALI